MPVVMGSQSHVPYTAPPADYIYITPGIYTLTIPIGVTSINAIAVGAGGNGTNTTGGGGGAATMRNGIAVTPGDVITIEVTAPGATATLNNPSGYKGTAQAIKSSSVFIYAIGANASAGGSPQQLSLPTGDTSSTGGNGGATTSSSSFQKGTGGGGAGRGGYTFYGNPTAASQGGGSTTTPLAANTGPSAGSGGGAGGEVNAATSPNVRDGGGGGGIGIFGIGADGVALGGTQGRGGGGGSPYSITVNGITYDFGTDGVSAGTSTTHIRPDGGFPGGGGGGSYDGAGFAGRGGGGVVRIFWGSGRSFPSNALPSDNITII